MSNTARQHPQALKPTSDIPENLLGRPKSPLRQTTDLIALPFRFVLPDTWVEPFGITSLRAERFGMALEDMRGRCIDIGAYDNALLKLYMKKNAASTAAQKSVGVDSHDWGAGCTVIESPARLPFEDASFDTLVIMAALNHIVERKETLQEAARILKPDGRIVLSMISRVVGNISHRVRFWGEHAHRHVDEEETFGLNNAEVIALLAQAGFTDVTVKPFLYGLNRLYTAQRPRT